MKRIALFALLLFVTATCNAVEKTIRTYDARGRVSGRIEQAGTSSRFYDDRGRYSGRADAGRFYDARGRYLGKVK